MVALIITDPLITDPLIMWGNIDSYHLLVQPLVVSDYSVWIWLYHKQRRRCARICGSKTSWPQLLPGDQSSFMSYIIFDVQGSLPNERGDEREEKMDISVIEPMYFCVPPCKKKCSKKSNLDRHRQSKACYHNLPFVCDVCKKRFHTEDLVVQHLKKGRCLTGETPPAVWISAKLKFFHEYLYVWSKYYIPKCLSIQHICCIDFKLQSKNCTQRKCLAPPGMGCLHPVVKPHQIVECLQPGMELARVLSAPSYPHSPVVSCWSAVRKEGHAMILLTKSGCLSNFHPALYFILGIMPSSTGSNPCSIYSMRMVRLLSAEISSNFVTRGCLIFN